jgi:2-dehydropantoate 2-reductase
MDEISRGTVVRDREPVVVFATGSIGSVVSAALVKAGLDVLSVDPWKQHLDAIRANGLQLRNAAGKVENVRLRIASIDEFALAKPRVEVALLCCKSYDTANYLSLIEPSLSPEGWIVSLQNAMNEPQIAAHVGADRTVGAIAILDGEIDGPGKVSQIRADTRVVAGLWNRDAPESRTRKMHEQIEETLGRGIRGIRWSENIAGEVATKVVRNSLVNGLSTVTDCVLSEIFHDDELRTIAQSIGQESARILVADGYELVRSVLYGFTPREFIAGQRADGRTLSQAFQLEYPATEPAQPSMLQDARVGRPLEIDHLNGWIVQRAKALGGSAPYNEMLVRLVNACMAGELQRGAEGRARIVAEHRALSAETAGQEA